MRVYHVYTSLSALNYQLEIWGYCLHRLSNKGIKDAVVNPLCNSINKGSLETNPIVFLFKYRIVLKKKLKLPLQKLHKKIDKRKMFYILTIFYLLVFEHCRICYFVLPAAPLVVYFLSCTVYIDLMPILYTFCTLFSGRILWIWAAA